MHIQGQDEGQNVATRKAEDGQNTVFSQNCPGIFGASFTIITDTQEQV